MNQSDGKIDPGERGRHPASRGATEHKIGTFKKSASLGDIAPEAKPGGNPGGVSITPGPIGSQKDWGVSECCRARRY